MSVDRNISIAVVETELQACVPFAEKHGWTISEIDKENLKFTVGMTALDGEKYHMEFTFDDYREIPLLIEFFDPISGERGTKKVYPKGKTDSFFHGFPCICNPCSRKSYKQFNEGAPHGDWKFADWQTNPQIKTLKTIDQILLVIYYRLNNPDKYDKRMA